MAKHLARSEKRPLKAEKQNTRRERRVQESDAGERGGVGTIYPAEHR